MAVWRRSPFYPLCLLGGALLFGSAGLAHPLLIGDGPTQLAVIAGTPAWRTIHWALLFGLPLMFAGLGCCSGVGSPAVGVVTGQRVRRRLRRGGGVIHRFLPLLVLRQGARRREFRCGGGGVPRGRARALLPWKNERPAPYGAAR